MVKSEVGWIFDGWWPDFVRSVSNFEVDMFIHMLFIHMLFIHMLFIHTIYSGYLFMEQAAKPIFLKNAGNYAKRCGLMRWSFFLLNEVIILSFW